MKTRLFLLAAAATIGFTACQNQNSGDGYTQEQLDSIVQYQTDSAAAALKMANDSTINAIADSVAQAEAAAASNTTVNKKSTTKKNNSSSSSSSSSAEKAVEPRTPAEMEADKKAARFGDAEAKARLERDEANKKAARFGDADAKQKVEQTEAQKKADRFNR